MSARVKGREWLGRHWTAVAACAFLFAFYWRGLDCWFYQDDFGWLHLGPAKDFGDFLQILFAPKAHGNIRPWSENLFFYGLKALFGVNPLPFRLVVFLTMAGSLFVLGAIMRRLTGSAAAALVTQVCWLASPAVAAVLCWTCIYNQAQYVLFVLLALWLLMEGRYAAQAAVFTLGLGALELAVMYPAIATLYTLVYDRSKLRRVLPLYLVSGAFTVLHFVVAPAPRSGPYAIQVDGRVWKTLWSYTEMALGPERLMHFLWDWPAWLLPAGTAMMAVLLAGAALAARKTGLLGAGAFLLLLAPVLPLPEHVMDYLLTGPSVGIAMIIGGAVAAKRWQAGGAAAVFFLAVCLPASWKVMTWNLERSHVARDLIQGVVAYGRAHPGKTLLLTGMDTDQFVAGFADLPFEVHGMYNVHLAPGAETGIRDAAGIAPLYVMKEEKARVLLESGEAVVLDVSGGRVRRGGWRGG
ncbi:MAG: hypothetical protein HY858_06295 [Candidatus Solibacter usitatus]|nr:hypothetical protein [Candidatus Solibacter usitatus]